MNTWQNEMLCLRHKRVITACSETLLASNAIIAIRPTPPSFMDYLCVYNKWVVFEGMLFEAVHNLCWSKLYNESSKNKDNGVILNSVWSASI